jgi:hypothetical protein
MSSPPVAQLIVVSCVPTATRIVSAWAGANIATVMATMATLNLKELNSIIELSSGGRARAGDNAGRHYRRRGATLEAITCIAVAGRSRHDSVAQRRKGFSQDGAMDRGIIPLPIAARIKLC